MKMSPVSLILSQDLPVPAAADGVGGEQGDALRRDRERHAAGLLEPVADKVGLPWHTPVPGAGRGLIYVGVAELRAHLLAADKGRVADDRVDGGQSGTWGCVGMRKRRTASRSGTVSIARRIGSSAKEP